MQERSSAVQHIMAVVKQLGQASQPQYGLRGCILSRSLIAAMWAHIQIQLDQPMVGGRNAAQQHIIHRRLPQGVYQVQVLCCEGCEL